MKALLSISFCTALLLGQFPAYSASFPAASGRSCMVVTPERHATEAGLEVLRRGGNAIDAAVAVSFALAVTYPRAGNLGGGGFLLYRSETGDFFALDHRERAPASLAGESFLDSQGRPVAGLSLTGGLSVGVPGSVAGLAAAHRKWGSLPWKSLVAPAIPLAEKGFRISQTTALTLAVKHDALAGDVAAAAIFMPDGRPLQAGDRLVQADLAASLREIALNGEAAFYEGTIGDSIVNKVNRTGGVMTTRDLADYRPIFREPLIGEYRGHRIVTFPPPSGGGVALLQILAILERLDVASSGVGSSLTVHRMVEAEKRAYADRARWLGDPDFTDIPVEALLNPEYIGALVAGMTDDRAVSSGSIKPWCPTEPESPETLHFSIADTAGRVVSMTTTLNSSYGSAMVADGTGILLNNEMDDFAISPGSPNQFGLTGGEANGVVGGKRPLSSMCPTMIERSGDDRRVVLALGSPGGATIITSVLQVVINVLDHRMPLQQAVDYPRFHHQWLPDVIMYEPLAFPADVRHGLLRRGHQLEIRSTPLGNVAALGSGPDGSWLGAADPRGEGTAHGF